MLVVAVAAEEQDGATWAVTRTMPARAGGVPSDADGLGPCPMTAPATRQATANCANTRIGRRKAVRSGSVADRDVVIVHTVPSPVAEPGHVEGCAVRADRYGLRLVNEGARAVVPGHPLLTAR